MIFTQIDNNYVGDIPNNSDLVVLNRTDFIESNFDNAIVLHGFDEVGMVGSDVVDPIYGFLDDSPSENGQNQTLPISADPMLGFLEVPHYQALPNQKSFDKSTDERKHKREAL